MIQHPLQHTVELLHRQKPNECHFDMSYFPK